MIQIRNVPADLHRAIKQRAAALGMTMSDYLLVEVRKALETPTMAEMLDRLAALPPADVDVDVAQMLHEERLDH